MSQPYKPPLPRRAQAVQSARGRLRQRWRWWWLVPLAGLLPVLVAAVLASEGALSLPGRGPVASPAPTAPAAAAQQLAAAPDIPTPVVTLPAQAGPTAAPTSVAVSTATVPAASPTAAVQRATTAPAAAPITATATSVSANAGASAASPQPQAETQVNGPFRAYRVQPGDTLKFVARMYGVSPASIVQASGLQNPDVLRPGQVLTVPAQPGWLYRLQPGETLDLIAARTGVSADLIASASNLPSASARTGDVILIPDQSVARSK